MALTSKTPKIKVMGVDSKKSYIPLEHNVYATQRVGRVVPYMARYCDANGKHKIDLETLNYMAPMIAPTVGDIRLKHWLYWIGFDRLSPTLANLFAKQKAVLYDGSEFDVTKVPYISLSLLTMLCLTGSFCTIYVRDKVDEETSVPYEDGATWLFPSNWLNPSNQDGLRIIENIWNARTSGDFVNNDAVAPGDEGKTVLAKYSAGLLGRMPSWTINAKYLTPLNSNLSVLSLSPDIIEIPLANPSRESFIDWRTVSGEPMYNGEHLEYTHGIDCTPVSLENPDYAVTRSLTPFISGGVEHEVSITFAFRFSDFGRALRDCIIASGDQLDISSSRNVSFLPFLAIYMAYFNAQPLQKYKNWQNTAAYKILRRYETANVTNIGQNMYDLQTNGVDASLFIEFINDLASMWAIEPQDYVSAHTREPITSPLVFNSLDQFLNNVSGGVSEQTTPHSVPIDQNGDSREEPNTIGDPENNLPYIDRVNHDVVTASLLKRITMRMAVNSIVGRPLRALLRLAGFGDWLDREAPQLVDYGELKLNLKPVVSTADTAGESSERGALLGQLGGRGYGHNYHNAKPYVNKQPGFFVLLTTVYIDSGYCQSIDANNFCVDVDDFYRRDFDAQGFEIDEKNQVHGSLTWVEEGDGDALNAPFGFIPRSTKFKVISNKLLGDFTNGQGFDTYSPYHLEKLLPVGKRSLNSESVEVVSNAHFTRVALGSRFSPKDLPIAGTIWRYLGRFPWLGQFDRIFKLYDYDVRKIQGVFGLESDNFFETVSKIYAYFISTPENYTFLNTIHYDSWQDKKPISESFGTLSEIFEGRATESVTKA